MKLSKILGTGFVSIIMLSTYGAQAFADDNQLTDQSAKTITNITIEDDTSTTDPIDPTNPNQKNLTLEHVPSQYNFKSTVSNKNYSIKSTEIIDGTIDVFNDRSLRNWAVKAEVDGNKLKKGNKSYNVTAFKINDILLKTGSETIVAKNLDNTPQNNTGLITTKVNTVSIDFDDTENSLKAGDELTGSINYKLYLVAEAY